MTGRVLDNGSYCDITPAEWRTGSILVNRSNIWVDYFYSDTLSSYQHRGISSWQSADQNVAMGNTSGGNNKIYASISPGYSFTVTGQVFIPASNIGSYDSVAVALRNDKVEYWATPAYGTDLSERNNISIIYNDVWGELYPLSLASEWYNIKVRMDYEI